MTSSFFSQAFHNEGYENVMLFKFGPLEEISKALGALTIKNVKEKGLRPRVS